MSPNYLSRILFVFCLIVTACAYNQATVEKHTNINAWPKVKIPVHDSADDIEEIETLLASMTLEEKVGQIMQAEITHVTPADIKTYHIGSVLNGGNTKPNQNDNATVSEWLSLADAFYVASMDTSDGKAAIPVIWGTDAVHGHALLKGATIFPHNIGLGATGNPELVKQIGSITARELRATGINWVFAPAVSVAQNDRWGRVYESYSEDPTLVSQLASALTVGLQGSTGADNFLDEEHVIATAKHFIADGGTFEGNDQGDARIDEQQLITIHNPGYAATIQAGVQTIMASFSSWNGKKLHSSRYLLTDVLKNRMGFDGLVVGDWNGHAQVPGCTSSSCATAINAGIDLVMVTRDWKQMIHNTLTQVRSGEISQQRLDDAVRRILRVKIRAGLFMHEPSDSPFAGRAEIVGHAQHRAVARQAVRESLVLLKNRNNILPLNPRQTILVAGDGANDIGKQCGGWSVRWQGSRNNEDFQGATSIYDGILSAVTNVGGKAILSVDGSYTEKPDAAIVVFGENPYAEGQGDLDSLEFEPETKKSLALLKSLHDDNIPVISIFVSGRPLWVNAEINLSDAFVAAWLPGSEGAGIADLLFSGPDGKVRYDFTGKLPFSWPKNPTQAILNPHHKNTYDPLFKFGYGLTYASALQGPVKLDENVADFATRSALEIPLYNGKILEPWSVYIRNQQRRQIFSGGFASLPNADVFVGASDKDIQGDALTLNWKNAHYASVYLAGGRPLDLNTYHEKGALTFDLKVENENIEYLSVLMKCGENCERRFPLAQYLSTKLVNKWQAISIGLSCFSQETDNFKRISQPFALESRGSGQVSIANIRFLANGKNNNECSVN